MLLSILVMIFFYFACKVDSQINFEMMTQKDLAAEQEQMIT